MSDYICLHCGTFIPSENINTEQNYAICKNCSYQFYFSELEYFTNSVPPAPMKEIPGAAGMRAFVQKGNKFISIFLFIFGSIFAIVGISPNAKVNPEGLSWIFTTVGSIIAVIGLGVFFYKTVIMIGKGTVAIAKILGPFQRTRSFKYNASSTISRAETNVSVNDESMTKILITTGHQSFDFGTMLPENVITFFLYILFLDKVSTFGSCTGFDNIMEHSGCPFEDVPCQLCGHLMTIHDVNVVHDNIHCTRCNAVFPCRDIAESDKKPETESLPERTSLLSSPEGMECYEIKLRSWGAIPILLFAALWDSFLAFFITKAPYNLFLFIFMIPFFLVGIGLPIYAVFLLCGVCRITIGKGKITYFYGIGSIGRSKTFTYTKQDTVEVRIAAKNSKNRQSCLTLSNSKNNVSKQFLSFLPDEVLTFLSSRIKRLQRTQIW